MLYQQESRGDMTEDESKRRASAKVDVDSIFVSRAEFQSSPVDLPSDIKTVENGGVFSEPRSNLFQGQNHGNEQESSQRLALSHNTTANGNFRDATLSSADLFKASPAQSWQSKSSDLFKGKEDDLFQAAKGDDFLRAARVKVDPFDKSASAFVDPFASPSNKEDDLFQFPKPAVPNLFSAAQTKETDLFQADPTKQDKRDTPTEGKSFRFSFTGGSDVFSSSSTNTFDPFASPIERDLFQDLSSLDDPFGSTPTEKYDLFQDISSGTPDIFQPLPSKRNIDSISSYSSLKSPSEMNLDIATSPHLSKKPPPPVPPKPFQKPQEISLTTPQGTKHSILRPTPIVQARDLSASPSQSPDELSDVCNEHPFSISAFKCAANMTCS